MLYVSYYLHNYLILIWINGIITMIIIIIAVVHSCQKRKPLVREYLILSVSLRLLSNFFCQKCRFLLSTVILLIIVYTKRYIHVFITCGVIKMYKLIMKGPDINAVVV